MSRSDLKMNLCYSLNDGMTLCQFSQIIQQFMEEGKEYDYMFKLILIGAAGVGKSNILLRYTKDQFVEGWNMTIGVQYATKIITTDKGTRIKFQIWDTAGQQRYRSLMKTFYKGASAAFIVYDVTKQQTFLSLDNELKLIKDYNKSDIITMIVGNKIDMEEQRTVSKQRGLDYAQNKKIAFYQVSAKEGTNVQLIFTRIAEELEKAVTQSASIQEPSQKDQSTSRKDSKMEKKEPEPETIVLNKQTEEKRKIQGKQKKKCCGE